MKMEDLVRKWKEHFGYKWVPGTILPSPPIDIRKGDEWLPTDARPIREAKVSGTLVEFYREWSEVYATIRIHEKEKPIGKADALELAKRIKTLYLDEHFCGLDDWRAFLTGQCLTLVPAGGPVHGGEFASANVMLLPNPGWRKGIVAFPAELVSAFGVRSSAWLNARLQSVWREFVARAAGDSSSRSGDFAFVLDRGPRPEPEPESMLLVPAPDEGAIAEFVGLAQSKIDHWEALWWAAAILIRRRQPLGDALNDWFAVALWGLSPKPDGRTRKGAADDMQRNLALNEVVCVLVDCGLPKAGDFGNDRVSACGIAGDVFEIGRDKTDTGGAWSAVSKAIVDLPRGNLFGR